MSSSAMPMSLATSLSPAADPASSGIEKVAGEKAAGQSRRRGARVARAGRPAREAAIQSFAFTCDEETQADIVCQVIHHVSQ